VSALISAFNSRSILTEKGGYIFKAASDSKKLHFGVLPHFLEGERTHHYDIELPRKFSEVLVGTLNPEGVFSILFIPKNKLLGNEELSSYRMMYIDLAAGLIERGLNITGCLDSVSVMMLRDSGVIPDAVLPLTLAKLAGYDRSISRNS
jgi:hypothetical protein